ncbi:MAG: PQQ-dependent dehydrogenase, methanol/ethanol family, partial [Gammaproteobacteria bacterium]|nr:PQQ-dependent dehydrogenase, methanol/ethanol family [Gammaproteobacteria bacterium]
MHRTSWLMLYAWSLLGVGAPFALAVDDAAIADVSNTAEWLTYGRNHNEQRFAPLDQINTGNVAGLKLDWYLDVLDAVGLVSTPLVADGVMYFVGS